MIPPPREKKRKGPGTDLICPGERCDARLGIRQGSFSPVTSLEPGYTSEPSERYQSGNWWRPALKDRMKRKPRARDLRKAYKPGLSFAPMFSPPRSLLDTDSEARARRAPRVGLWPGSQIVVCYKCQEPTSIEIKPPTWMELPPPPFRPPNSLFR